MNTNTFADIQAAFPVDVAYLVKHEQFSDDGDIYEREDTDDGPILFFSDTHIVVICPQAEPQLITDRELLDKMVGERIALQLHAAGEYV